MKIVNVHDAKTHLSRLLEEARAGEDVIIAKNGEPYVRLVRVEPRPPRAFGFLHGSVDDAFFEPLAPEELDQWT